MFKRMRALSFGTNNSAREWLCCRTTLAAQSEQGRKGCVDQYSAARMFMLCVSIPPLLDFNDILHMQGGDGTGVSEVHTQELAAKISENERLHMKVHVDLISKNGAHSS